MATIAIEDWMFFGSVALSAILFLGSIMLYFTLKNNAPDSFMHWKAARKGNPICRVHFRGGKCMDCVAEIDKSEKEIGTPYWTVPEVGIKFKPHPGDIEFIEGGIACVNYFMNVPAAIATKEAVAYSQLKDHLKKIGCPIDGIEDIAMYVAADAEKVPGQRAIKNARIESAETRKYLTRYLNVIEAKKKELSALKLESGIFTWQTAMRALDSTIAYTSAHIAHTKEVIRAAILRSEENKRKDYIMYAIIAFILCIGAATLIIVTRQ